MFNISMPELILLVIGIAVILWFTWQSLRLSFWHGVPRLFAFAAILALGVLNLRWWFDDPFAWYQVISWVLLCASLGLVLHAVWLLRQMGKPQQGSFEATTQLVQRGAYRFIRHPMYASLLLLAWGICLKGGAQVGAQVGAIHREAYLWYESPLLINLLLNLGLAALATLCLVLTARVEESENLARFGEPYRAYMRRTKRFIPFVF